MYVAQKRTSSLSDLLRNITGSKKGTLKKTEFAKSISVVVYPKKPASKTKFDSEEDLIAAQVGQHWISIPQITEAVGIDVQDLDSLKEVTGGGEVSFEGCLTSTTKDKKKKKSKKKDDSDSSESSSSDSESSSEEESDEQEDLIDMNTDELRS